MKKGNAVGLVLATVAMLMALPMLAQADRGGWADPPGGWDIVYEGSALPLDDGWYNGGGSDDPGGYNPDDLQLLTIAGQGETEDGVNPAADALVLQVQDNSPGTDGTGRKIKFMKPFAGTYNTGVQDNLINLNGGVTIVVRFKVVPGTLSEPEDQFTYRHYFVGVDASDNAEDRAGLSIGEQWARWARGDDTVSTPMVVGDLTAGFRTFWIVIERKEGDPNNWTGTLYVDGSVTPTSPPMTGPGDTGPDGYFGTADDNATRNWFSEGDEHGSVAEVADTALATFGPGRTPAQITIQYDYICWKVGAYHPQPAGPPEAPTNLTASYSAGNITLQWQDNSDNEDGFAIERKEGAGGTYTEIGRTAQNVTSYVDSSLQPGVTYYYRVRAYRGDQYSDYSNEVSYTTPVGSLRARDWNLYDKN